MLSKDSLFLSQVVNQEYTVFISPTHVMVGNDALIKCDIPGFVTDLVTVVSWVDDQANTYSPTSFGTYCVVKKYFVRL